MKRKNIIFTMLLFCCACMMINASAEKELDVCLVSFDGADHSNLEEEKDLDFLVKNYFIPEEKAKDMLKKNTLATYFIKINFIVNVESFVLKDATVCATNANEMEVWPSWQLLISSGGFRQPLTVGDVWQDGFWVDVNIEDQNAEEIEKRIRETNFICEMVLEDESGKITGVASPISMKSGERSVYQSDALYDCEYDQYMVAPTDAKIVEIALGMQEDYKDIKVKPENYRLIYLIGSEFLKTPTPIYNLKAEGQNGISSMWYRCLYPGQYYKENAHHNHYDVIDQQKRSIVTVVLFRADISDFENDLKKMGIDITFSMDGLSKEDQGIIAAGQWYTTSAHINDLTEIPYDTEYLQTLLMTGRLEPRRTYVFPWTRAALSKNAWSP